MDILKMAGSVKKIVGDKKTREVASKAIKVANSLGIDIAKVLPIIVKNADVISALANIGLKKGSDPASASVQKLVSSLKTKISNVVGTKLKDKDFQTIVNKLVSNPTVKAKVEKLSSTGVTTFIKKAISEYAS